MTPTETTRYIRNHLFQGSILRHATFGACAIQIKDAANTISECFEAGGKLLLFGNGGSAADAQHIAAELVGWYRKRLRDALPAIALTESGPALTAIANDTMFCDVFSRQVEALGKRGDVAFGISTSGSSTNVSCGLGLAEARGLATIALTGDQRFPYVTPDIEIMVPENNTALVQEAHIAIGHIICGLIEERMG